MSKICCNFARFFAKTHYGVPENFYFFGRAEAQVARSLSGAV